MSFSDLFKKKPISEKQQLPENMISNTKLAQKISLRKELVIDEVKKQNISVNTARVVFVLDHSGSMRTMYKNGTVQDLLERIFPIADTDFLIFEALTAYEWNLRIYMGLLQHTPQQPHFLCTLLPVKPIRLCNCWTHILL